MPVTTYRLRQATLKQSTNPVIKRLVANHFYLDAKEGGVTIGRDMQRAALQLNVNGTVIDHTLDGLTAVFEDNNRLIKQKVLAISPDLKNAYEDTEKAYAQPCRSTIENAVGAIVKNPCPSVVHSVIEIDEKHNTNKIASKLSQIIIPGIPQLIDCQDTTITWSLVDVDEEVYCKIKDAEIAELEKKKNPSTPRTAGAIDRQIEHIKNQPIPKKIYQLTEISVKNRLLQEALMSDDWQSVRKLTELVVLCDKYLAECKAKIESMLKQEEFLVVALPYTNTAEYQDNGRVVINSGIDVNRFIGEYKSTDTNELGGFVEKYKEMTALKLLLENTDKSASSRIGDFHAAFKEKQPILEDPNDNTLVKILKTFAIVLSACFLFIPGYFAYQKLWKNEKGAELSQNVERLVSAPRP